MTIESMIIVASSFKKPRKLLDFFVWNGSIFVLEYIIDLMQMLFQNLGTVLHSFKTVPNEDARMFL